MTVHPSPPAHEPVATPHRLIRASAGSGKTYQLAVRYLSLLRLGAEPGSILATTFTRKAAGQIFGRVLNRLARAIEDDKALADLRRDLDGEPLRGLLSGDTPALTRDDCRAMLDRLIDDLHRVRVSTLDSFFFRLVRSFALELEVPPDPAITDDGGPEARELRLRAIEAMLGEAAGGPGEPDELQTFITLLRQVHHDQTVRSVTESIDNLVAELYEVYREAGEASLWSRLPTPGLLTNEQLEAAIEALAAMEPALPRTKAGKPRASWGRSLAESVRLAQLGDWQSFIAKGLPAAVADEGKGGRFDGVELTSEWLEVLQPLVRHARAVMLGLVARQTQSTFELLRRFDGHFNQLRRRHRLLLFSDLAHKLARELPNLGDDVLTEVYFRLDGRLHHLLVDEFQDTSRVQWQVLAPLVDDATAQAEADRSVFIVGDTKQSIYGWRGGCVELFDVVQDRLSTRVLTADTLQTSYRSTPVVLDAVNAVFESLANNPALVDDHDVAERWQAGYRTHESAPHLRGVPGHVRVMSSPAITDGAADDHDADSDDDAAPPTGASHEAWVAHRIAELHREAPGRSLGVLVRRNRTARTILYHLHRLGVEASGEGASPITDLPAVTAVLAALILADHPGDEVAAFHVANSPVGALVELRDPTDRAAVRRVAAGIRQRLLHDGFAEVISDWVRRLAPACDGRSLDRLEQLVELAERFDVGAGGVALRPGQFVRYVEGTPLDAPTADLVRVMTIHAAKGLEFDVVVLPELDATLNDRTQVLVEREHPTGPVTAVYRNPDKALRALSPELTQAYDAYRQRQRFEDLCTLYVAMTRAERALHIYLKPRRLNRSGQLGKLPKTLGSVVREALRDPSRDEDPAGGEVLYEAGDPTWSRDTTRPPHVSEAEPDDAPAPPPPLRLDLPVHNGAARRSWRTVTPSSLESQGQVRAADLLNLEGDASRQRGTLVHAWLQMVGFLDDDDGGVPDDPTLLDIGRRMLPGAGDAWVTEQLAEFRRMLARPAVRTVLSRQGANDLWREQPFAVSGDGQLLRGSFDRVALQRERDRVTAATLIDFKTDAFNDEAIERYRPQLAAYRRALAKLVHLPAERITAKLVFLQSGDVVDV